MTEFLGLVLVVDDNAENRELARQTLEDEGYRVTLARDADEALEAFVRARPDCVLMDIRMPRVDGIEACRRIRALPGSAETPILFLTAQRDVEMFDRAREAGGDDYITKPVRPPELVTRVAAGVKLRRMAVERRELYDVVRQQRDDLMRLQLHKEQLSAFLVHDLKNPVSSIDLQTQRIARDPNASPRCRDAAARIADETRSLMRMISNLLDISKADEGRLVPVHGTLVTGVLFDEVTALLDARARAQNVQLATRGPRALALCVDVDLVRRVCENLVDNALRHAPEESVVTLEVAARDETFELRVSDQGPGVPPALRAQIFERFVQSPTTATRTNRGLGLSFCKLAVEAHGGRIWVEDGSPGAVFCVALPQHRDP